MFEYTDEQWSRILSQVKLVITTRCNLACPNCNMLCDLVSGGDMAVEQVEEFFKQTLSCRKRWLYITLTGGEPSIHPQLQDILQVCADYRDKLPFTSFHINTNGYNIGDKLDAVPSWMTIKGSCKSGTLRDVEHFCIGPAWPHPPDRRDACMQPVVCGFAYTAAGWVICSGAGRIAELFDMQHVCVEHLKDVSRESLERSRLICERCNYQNYPGERARDVPAHGRRLVSPEWSEAIRRHEARCAMKRGGLR